MTYELDVFDNLISISADYRQLIESSQHTSFDQTVPWFDAFATHIMTAPEKIRVYALRADGKPLAVLPLVVKKQSIFGESLQALANFYTAFTGPILDSKADPQSTLSQLISKLLQHTPVYQIDLNPLLRDKRFTLIAQCFRDHGCFVEEYFRFGNWVLNLEQRTFDEYHASLPSKLRSTIKRKTRSLENLDGVEICIVTDPADVDKAMSDYETIYNLSWKHSEPFPDFIRTIALKFAQRGWLRLGVIRLDNRPIAAQLWFVVNGVASIFKLAYDPDYSKTSAGSVLSAKLFAYAIDEDRVTMIDYLCGDDAYKEDWMNLRKECWGIRAYASQQFAGRVLGWIARLKQFGRSLTTSSKP